MLAHFDKLQTPIHAANKYPTTTAQEERFRTAGWTNVWARNLWELWSSANFLTSDERASLDKIEPFDEWEEFALFAGHYFLLVASNDVPCKDCPYPRTMRYEETYTRIENSVTAEMSYAEYEKAGGRRRFAAPLLLRGSNRQQDLVGNFAGMGLNTRLNSCDVYKPTSFSDQALHKVSSTDGPQARMCHTITDLGEAGSLLVGGRTSPDNGLADCWLYHKWTNTWERIDDLPMPRYRHSAVVIGNNSVLVAGGKSDSRSILTDFIIWTRRSGWVKCSQVPTHGGITGDEQPAAFGAILTTMGSDDTRKNKFTGLFAGGLSQDGCISQETWFWRLHMQNEAVRNTARTRKL
jgi:tRNA wybutosine-synthesizing protein 4